MPYQLPSPAYTIQSRGSHHSSQLGNYNMETLFSTLTEINGQLLNLRQQQASSINAIGSLSNDMAHLTEEMKKIKGGTSSRGGRGGKGSRGRGRGRGARGN